MSGCQTTTSDLPEIFAFELDPGDIGGSHKLLIEAGLLVAFMVDGECPPVDEAHAGLKRALVSRRLHKNHVEALMQALIEHEAELKSFAGL